VRRLLGSLIHIVAACGIVPSTALLAQSPSATPVVATARKTHWCFRGRPRPTCDHFLLTELGVAKSLTRDSASLYTGELGWMVNRGTRVALGAGVFVQDRHSAEHLAESMTYTTGGNETGIGIRPRLRWWMSRDISVDIAPGIILFGSGASVGFSGHVDLNVQDIAAVTAHIVSRPQARVPGVQTDVFVGGRVGSTLAAIVGGALLVLLGVLSSDHS
jgi:hypothetical protein